MGTLERAPDPSDGRARLIRFRQGGLMEGLGGLMDLERELGEAIGPEAMRGLRRGLLAMRDALEPG